MAIKFSKCKDEEWIFGSGRRREPGDLEILRRLEE
jgi:hypothetical protein